MAAVRKVRPPKFNDTTGAIRALAMDAVQKANSGHPGAPMGMAEIAEVLWNHHLRHNPANPKWADRDRFVLSNGHGSMLIYALLHLTGYDLPIEELKNFRKLHSKTPGHPEYGYTAGVETTTGPLGQGITNAVGFALAEKMLAHEFNRPGHEIVNHHTYVFMGDGCMMEGISHESCALAGTWAIKEAKSVTDKPTLICCKTIIGAGSPNKADTHDVHGAALGDAEVAATREFIGWKYPPFEIPAHVYQAWDARTKGAGLEKLWDNKFAEYRKAYPAEAAEFERRTKGDLPANWAQHAADVIAKINDKAETIATRKASQNAINALVPVLPEFLGGSADLTGSNLTNWTGAKHVHANSTGNYISYGVREFGMSAIMNGLALHGGLLPFGGTFLMFSEYARNALRMAALMKLRVLFVYTHDSIGLGEDGPTHQAVEQTATLRYIPNMDVWRPCDTVESAVSWVCAVERKTGPSSLLFSRQNLAFQKRDAAQIANIGKGAYILSEAAGGKAQAIIIATGSEVGLAMDAQKALAQEGIHVRVVSMPSTNVFDRQDQAYKDSVLPKGSKRVAVEAGITGFWYKYVGLEGAVVGIDTFGESAPAGDLFKHFGFTTENVVKIVKQVL